MSERWAYRVATTGLGLPGPRGTRMRMFEVVDAGTGRVLATVQAVDEEGERVARLIAAAPVLAEVALRMGDHLERLVADIDRIEQSAGPVLAQAAAGEAARSVAS